MPRFLLKRAITLLLILSACLVALLIAESPTLAHTPFGSIEIQPSSGPAIHLPNRIFSCVQGVSQWECSTSLAEQPLDLTWNHTPQYEYELMDCRATYAGRSVPCESTGADYIRGLQYRYTLQGDLGLGQPQLQGLRRQFWGINLLMKLREGGLIGLILLLSLAAGMLIALGAWLRPGRWAKVFVSFACGIGMAILVAGRLSSILLETLNTAGIDYDEWNQIQGGLAIAAGIGTWICTAALLYFPFTQGMRLIVSLLAGVSLFSLWAQSIGIGYLLSFLGLPIHNSLIWGRLPIFIASAAAWMAAFWLYRRHPASRRRFLSFTGGLGMFTLGSLLGMFCLLWLGYAD